MKRGRIASAHQNQNHFPTVNVPQDDFYLHLPLCWQQAALRCRQLPSLSVSRCHYRLNSPGLLSVLLWEAATDNTGQKHECIHSLVCNNRDRNGSRLDQQSAYVFPRRVGGRRNSTARDGFIVTLLDHLLLRVPDRKKDVKSYKSLDVLLPELTPGPTADCSDGDLCHLHVNISCRNHATPWKLHQMSRRHHSWQTDHIYCTHGFNLLWLRQ